LTTAVPPTTTTEGSSAPSRDRIASFIRRHPLSSFIAWFFTIGQAIAFVPALFTVGIRTEYFIMAATAIGLLLPALVITRVADGPDALRRFLRRIVRTKAPARWYAFAIIGVPLTAFLAVFALSGPPDQAGSTVPSAITSGLLLQLVVLFLTVNWFEEVAWMGFVQARLQDRYGPMRAAAVGGALFALGHISMFVGQAPSAVAVVMTVLIVVAIPFRALLAWVYNRTGSLVLVGLIHAAGNATALGSVAGAGLLPRLYPADRNGDLVIPILAVLGVLVILATRTRLGYAVGGESRTAAS
jgi:uncharacterized protein